MASEVAQAYVQIMPSAKGIKGSISKAMGGEAISAGASAGSSLIGGIKHAIAAAGIGAAIGKAIKEGAAMEQSEGGIDTLFKDSAEIVKQRANEAYKTAGLSANQYMELATSFSASLLQSLGGDTAKAADIADMAMTDMSDNANKMGTDMTRIQDAYQGFAKQNYTMLDNLKLGYGGTKTEMQRLLTDAEAISGVKYDIANLNDVYEAIHVIQGELDITGTTAKEASTTISGSANAMKAAFSTLAAKITLGQDIGPALDAVMQTTTTFAINLIPAILNIFKALPGALATVIKTAGPQIMAAGKELITGITTGIQGNMSSVFASGMNIITNIGMSILQNLPRLLAAGGKIILGIVQGIASNLPAMLSAAGQAISTLLTGVVQNLPKLLKAGFDLIVNMVTGIGNAAPNIISAIGDLMQKLWNTVKEIDWLDLGINIVQGIINGIGSMAGALWNAAKNIGKSCLDAIKGALGIASPSRVMRDEVGKWIPAGIAEGIEGNVSPIRRAMQGLASTTTGNLSFGGFAPALAGGPAFVQNVYTHDSLSPSELTREAEDMMDRRKWGLP